jgi:hypothetical protein
VRAFLDSLDGDLRGGVLGGNAAAFYRLNGASA